MSDLDDLEVLAAEFVLGTLDVAERAAVVERRQRDTVLDTAIAAWERRIGPLAETVPSVAPPADLFARIEARIAWPPVAPVRQAEPVVIAKAAMPILVAPPIVVAAKAVAAAPVASAPSAAAPPSADVIQLRRRLRNWRAGTFVLGALAASLAIGFGLREYLRPPVPKNYVAVLQKDPASTAFLLSVDLEKRNFTIRPVSAQAQPGKSYELWLVDSKLGAKSLGVVGDQAYTTRASLNVYDRLTVAGATYAVSLEPSGGSPTGAPTGPVVFTGQLVQTSQ